nr:hypothetical protein [Bacteroidota bacterium]
MLTVLQALNVQKSYKLTNNMLKLMHRIEAVRDFDKYFKLEKNDVRESEQMAGTARLKAHFNEEGMIPDEAMFAQMQGHVLQ